MGTIYTRGTKLWLRIKQPDGKWASESSGFSVGEEDKAKKKMKVIEDSLKAITDFNTITIDEGPVTVTRYAKRWLEGRKKQGIASACDEEGRITNHILPLIGPMLVADVRPRHVRDMVLALRVKKAMRGGDVLAPKTVRHVYAIFRTMMRDAFIDELVDRDPCALKRGVLPKKTDKDPNWRSTAIFSRDEVERLISDDRIPEDRHVFYAMLFLGAMRFGEASARSARRASSSRSTRLGPLPAIS
jgi:integrase